MCSSVVYSYKCPGCHALYYGKTTRNLDTRCREHLGINKAGQKIKSNCSAIGDHISKFGHNGSLEDFDILSKTENSLAITKIGNRGIGESGRESGNRGIWKQ